MKSLPKSRIPASWPRPGRRVLLPLAALFAVVAIAYLGWVEHSVSTHFAEPLWPEPARVYASPLELYAGAPLGRDELATELERLGYAQRRQLDRNGSWSGGRGSLRIRTRGFHFADGPEAATVLRLDFDGDRISRVRADSTGMDLALARLDPLLIGSIYPETGEDRILLEREEFPPLLVDILLAVEDQNFGSHFGLDPRGLLRAAWVNLRAGEIEQGGSTITQQLVKNRILRRSRRLPRKFHELFMAVSVERRLDKEQILHAYLNEIYMGQDGKRPIHGLGLASRYYFGRPLDELEAHQHALLVALVKGPSVYNPWRRPELAKQRRDLVLQMAQEQEVLGPEAAAEAMARELDVAPRPQHGGSAYPAMLELVARQLKSDYPEEVLSSEGLSIFTTLVPRVQAKAEEALYEGLQRLERRHGMPDSTLEGSVVVSSVDGAEVLAVVGGRHADFQGFNRALDAMRPVGSLLKPAVYLAALRSGEYDWSTTVLDSSLTLDLPNGDRWSPQNHDGELHGRVPLFDALMQSHNLATVRVALDVGMDEVVDALVDLGLQADDLKPYPSLALGAVALAPLDMLQLYNTLAAGGFRSRVKAVRDVVGPDGELSQRYPLEVEQAVDPALAFMVSQVLQRSTEHGTASPLQLWMPGGFPVAAKTGTSDDFRDSWFAGFSGDRVAVAWVGRDDNQPVGLSGARGALPIWGAVMSGVSDRGWAPLPPAGLQEFWVELDSGDAVGEGCEGAIPLAFQEDRPPEREGGCGDAGLDGDRRKKGWLQRLFGGR